MSGRLIARIQPFVPMLTAALYAVIVAGPGVPVLRQDWSAPTTHDGIIDLFVRSTSGWDPHGLGSPNLYINDYLVGSAFAALDALLGPHLGLFIVILGVGVACAYGAAALARVFGGDAWGRSAAALFAVFNPWVYAETIAGHLYMLLAYGALMALAAECLRKQPRPLIACVLAVLTLQQLQLFAAACVLVVAGLRRLGWLPLVTAAVVGAPVAASLVMERTAIASVPYTLAWERLQSVEPWDALTLSGYFAGYTQAIAALDRWLMPLALILVAVGFALRARSKRGAAMIGVTALALLASMGFRGPLAQVAPLIADNGPAARLFRELYDFLAFAAIGFATAVGVAATRARAAAAASIVVGVGLAAAWLVWSPWTWWVAGESLPSPSLAAPPNTRFALYPAFQPLQLTDGMRGSGSDPEATDQARGVTPLNELFPSFPVDAALSRYAATRDPAGLAALGVSTVVGRSWLREDSKAMGYGRALPAPVAPDGANTPDSVLEASPELAVVPLPRACAVCADAGADAVFFGDAAGVHDPGAPPAWTSYPHADVVAAPDVHVSAADGWVDARLSFSSDPELAQPFGGALTTSRAASLPLGLDRYALVFVRGALVDNTGSVVARDTRGYRWIALPAATRSVRCAGRCLVALTAPEVPDVPAEAPSKDLPIGVPFEARFPWRVEATVPPGRASMVRYLVRFDDAWSASLDGKPLAHVRVDGYANGWLLPSRSTPSPLVIVHDTSAAQAALECAGAIWTVGTIVAIAVPRRRMRAGVPSR